MLLIVTSGHEAFGNCPLQIKRLFIRRSILQSDFALVAVDVDYDFVGCLAHYPNCVESRVFEISAKMPSEVRDSGDSGKWRKGYSHRFCRAGKLWYASQRPVGKNEWIFGIHRSGAGIDGFVQEIKAKAPATQEIIPHPQIKLFRCDRSCSQINAENRIGITPPDWLFYILHAFLPQSTGCHKALKDMGIVHSCQVFEAQLPVSFEKHTGDCPSLLAL